MNCRLPLPCSLPRCPQNAHWRSRGSSSPTGFAAASTASIRETAAATFLPKARLFEGDAPSVSGSGSSAGGGRVVLRLRMEHVVRRGRRRVQRAARSRRAERLALSSSVRRPIRAAPTSKTMPTSLPTRPAAPASAQQLHRSDVRHTVQAGVRQCGRIFCRFSAAAPRPARENSEKKHESRIP